MDRPASPWIRLGAYAVVSDDLGQILGCRIAPGYPWAGTWTLPGGGVEWGEHPDAAVIRELEEETGLSGRIERLIGIDSQTIEHPVSRPGPAHVVAILYRVTDVTGELQVEQGGSTDACAWLTTDELATLPHVPLMERALLAMADE
jgi:8-oxo-dGTP diphosphatase